MSGRYSIRAYGQRDFTLPTTQRFVPILTSGRTPPTHKLSAYGQRAFTLPTSGHEATLMTPSCSSCGAAPAKQTRSFPPKRRSSGMGYLGDDGDIFDTSGLSPIETTDSGLVPTDTSINSGLPSWYGTGALETTAAGGGLAPNPGTFGTSSLNSILNSLVQGGSNIAAAAVGSQNGQQASSLSQQVPGLGGLSYGTLLLFGGGALLVVLLVKKK